ncbi:hypothetical protein WR164_10700 [Philodulcilactobacillus myokoensis]|uniref:VOC domain-containing protein n=1 Tax=Philodulcilactobacillus myokoensis TaxID=2929573 RepID=A0A9W6ESI7_9LACO|nr:VOC family protein [Philodulcilactobacillus myokoensis]GLB47091.1 hypothetical protein WR164_10700 [Philodulcilactobacillus myokoensis]
MEYKIPVNASVGLVALRIDNLNQMIDFYTKVIGLSLLKRTEREAYLGIDSSNKVLISLRRVQHPEIVKNETGMASFSIVLPDNDDFKKCLVHINNLGIKLSDIYQNGYYDIVKLIDPEGNHIVLEFKKFHSDLDVKDINLFDINAKKIKLNDYLEDFNAKSKLLPSSAFLGWINIFVSNLSKSIKFYHDQLGLKVCFNHDKTAAILTTENERRQIVLTEKNDLSPRKTEVLGLDYINFKFNTALELTQLANHLENGNNEYKYIKEDGFLFVIDPDDMNVSFSII